MNINHTIKYYISNYSSLSKSIVLIRSQTAFFCSTFGLNDFNDGSLNKCSSSAYGRLTYTKY